MNFLAPCQELRSGGEQRMEVVPVTHTCPTCRQVIATTNGASRGGRVVALIPVLAPLINLVFSLIRDLS